MKIEGESGLCVHNILCVLDLRCTSVGGPVVGVGANVGAARQACHQLAGPGALLRSGHVRANGCLHPSHVVFRSGR